MSSIVREILKEYYSEKSRLYFTLNLMFMYASFRLIYEEIAALFWRLLYAFLADIAIRGYFIKLRNEVTFILPTIVWTKWRSVR